MAERFDDRERPGESPLIYIFTDGEKIWPQAVYPGDEFGVVLQSTADTMDRSRRELIKAGTPKKKSTGRERSKRDQKKAREGFNMKLDRLPTSEIEALRHERILPIRIAKDDEGHVIDCTVEDFDTRRDYYWGHFLVEYYDLVSPLFDDGRGAELNLVQSYFNARFDRNQGDTHEIQKQAEEDVTNFPRYVDDFLDKNPTVDEDSLAPIFSAITSTV